MSDAIVETVEGEDASTPSHSMLRSFIERIERLDEEIAGIRADRKDVVAEAKTNGFDPGALRAVIQRRKIEPDKLKEMDALVETYECALGGMGRNVVWGGELRAQKALPKPKATDRGRKAAEALALVHAVERAEQA